MKITLQKVKEHRDVRWAMITSKKCTWTTLISMEENGYQFDLIVQHLETSNRPSLRLELCKNGAVLTSKRIDFEKFKHLDEIIAYMAKRFAKELPERNEEQ